MGIFLFGYQSQNSMRARRFGGEEESDSYEMNAFEQIIAGLLQQEGYWTFTDYKVNISKEVKAALGKPSMPRPELDILAYKAAENIVLWVECKSYLDSKGVKLSYFTETESANVLRYKVFTWPEYRESVTEALVSQLVSRGLVCPNPTVRYGLAAGRIATDLDRKGLREHFKKHQWLLFDEVWIKEKIKSLSKIGYEDDVAIIVAKLFSGTEILREE